MKKKVKYKRYKRESTKKGGKETTKKTTRIRNLSLRKRNQKRKTQDEGNLSAVKMKPKRNGGKFYTAPKKREKYNTLPLKKAVNEHFRRKEERPHMILTKRTKKMEKQNKEDSQKRETKTGAKRNISPLKNGNRKVKIKKIKECKEVK